MASFQIQFLSRHCLDYFILGSGSMYVIDSEILLCAYNIYSQDAEEKSNGSVSTGITVAIGKVFYHVSDSCSLRVFVLPCLNYNCLLSSSCLQLPLSHFHICSCVM